MSIVSEAGLAMDKLHFTNRKQTDIGPTCWQGDTVDLCDDERIFKRHSAGPCVRKIVPGYTTPPGLIYHPPQTSAPSLPAPYPGVDPGLSTHMSTGHLDLRGLMPSSAKRPSEGIQPGNYPYESLSKQQHQPASTDPMELMLGRMGEMSTSNKDLEIERFREYVVFDVRGFGSSRATLGTGCYGSDLEASLKRQSVTHREILSLQGIRVPITNRIARACPILDWGLDYGSSPDANTLMINDFTPWLATKLDEFRISRDKLETRGNPRLASIWSTHLLNNTTECSELYMVRNMLLSANRLDRLLSSLIDVVKYYTHPR